MRSCRRNLLRVLATSGGAVTLSQLPSGWTSPVVESALLPAHAQTTGEEVEPDPPVVSRAPLVLSVIADDPDNGDTVLSAGDTVTITFDRDTSANGGIGVNQTKVQVDSLFIFSDSLGADYDGLWSSASVFVITVINVAGNGSPAAGVTTVSPGVDLITDPAEPAPAPAWSVVSPPLSGDFGV